MARYGDVLVRNTDPETSHDAAQKLAPHVGPIDRLIIATLAAGGAMTSAEVATTMRTSLHKISSRFSRLRERGILANAGKRANPDTGVKALLWAVVQ